MAIIAVFQTSTSDKFLINGYEVFKIFNVRKIGANTVDIVNVYDNQQSLFNNIRFDEISVDGVVYTNVVDLITNLTSLIYKPASLGNASQSQIDDIQTIIDDLPTTYADINHQHPGLYLTEQEILNLFPGLNGTNIQSGVVDGNNLKFFDNQEQLVFQVNIQDLKRQGTILEYNQNTGLLRLKNGFNEILSTQTIQAKNTGYDRFEYVENIENDLSNLLVDNNFLLIRTLNDNFYFINATNLDLDGTFRITFVDSNYSTDLSTPTFNESTYKAYLLQGIDPIDYQSDGLVQRENFLFNFWRIIPSTSAADMMKSTYDPQLIEGDAFDRSNHTGQETTDDIEDGAITEIKLDAAVITKLNEVVGAGGYAGNVYYTDLDSVTVPAYKQLSYEDDAAATIIGAIVNDEEILIEEFIFDGDVLTTQIPSGLWVFNTFCQVSSSQAISKIRHEVFARTAGGVETVLFSLETDELNNLSYEMIKSQTSKPSYSVNETDRLGVKLYANTTRTSDTTINIQLGNGNGSYLTAPLQIRHNQTRGRDEADAHPIDAISGLQAALNAKESKYSRLDVTTSRNLANTDNNKTLIIDGTVTLTFPSVIMEDFNFNFKVKVGGSLTIANGAKNLIDTEETAQTQIVADASTFGTVYQFDVDTFIVEGI